MSSSGGYVIKDLTAAPDQQGDGLDGWRRETKVEANKTGRVQYLVGIGMDVDIVPRASFHASRRTKIQFVAWPDAYRFGRRRRTAK